MEGPRFLRDQMSRSSPEFVLVSSRAEGLSARVALEADRMGFHVLEVREDLFEELADTETSQGIMGVFSLPEAKPDDIPDKGIMLLLDGISDPGNMGTIIRSAAAFECSGVICGRGSCFPFLPKVTRAAAGHNASIPVLTDTDLPGFIRERSGQTIFAGADPGGVDLRRFRPDQRGLGLVIGSEAHGISGTVLELLDARLAIPMRGGVESLNAAVSTAIILYHLNCHDLSV